MLTQTTQQPPVAHYQQHTPQQNALLIKLISALVAGVLLFLAIRTHQISDCFGWFLAVTFDGYSLRILDKNYLPDIVLLILSTLMLFGLYHCLRFHLAATVFLLLLWGGLAFYFSGVSISFDLESLKKPLKKDAHSVNLDNWHDTEKRTVNLPLLDTE